MRASPFTLPPRHAERPLAAALEPSPLPSPVLAWSVLRPRSAEWIFGFTTSAGPSSQPASRPAGFFAIAGRWSAWTSPSAGARTWSRRAEIPECHRAGAIRTLLVVREIRFSARWKAKDRAWRWRCARAEEPFESWHQRPRIDRAERARRAAQMRRDGC